jgi:tRNA-specific 2-thiouridylase
MSGGVDSSTAAALLHESGAEVVGVTLKLYDASGTSASIGGRCCSPRDIDDARATAATLGFAHYVLDETAAFRQAVIDDFVHEYRVGRTPNPCVRCNERLKFGPLVRFARAVGATALATGHYARVSQGPDGVRLERAIDRDKDQAYFLFGLRPDDLAFVRFPLGHLAKSDVRAAARRMGLHNCDKPDSQQICFIPDGNHRTFVESRGGAGRPGRIVDETGTVISRHEGTHLFTIGQRKGLPAGAERRFVLDIDAATGTVTTGPRERLGRREMSVADVRWLRPAAAAAPFTCETQIRHHSQGHSATVSPGPDGRSVRVVFDEPVEGVAPGQAAVFYQGERVVAGGWIEAEETASATGDSPASRLRHSPPPGSRSPHLDPPA